MQYDMINNILEGYGMNQLNELERAKMESRLISYEDRILGIVRKDQSYLKKYDTAFMHFLDTKKAYEDAWDARERYTHLPDGITAEERKDAEKEYLNAKRELSNLLLNPPRVKEPNQYFFLQIDELLKNDFEKFCAECTEGLSVTMAVNIFVKRMIKEGRIPFPVEPLEVYRAIGGGKGDKQEPVRMSLRLSKDVQEQFAVICDEIGITRSVAVRMYMLRCLHEKRIDPFHID
ncbi:MAG: hypothetical protein LUC32_01745 [Clostridiales bacterium]|nr:hypothetical protein [Clostridiales bacterium]